MQWNYYFNFHFLYLIGHPGKEYSLYEILWNGIRLNDKGRYGTVEDGIGHYGKNAMGCYQTVWH